MANVFVDEMKCVDETGSGIDEWTSDDIYMLLFRGEIPTGPGLASRTEFTVTGPGAFWDEMDDGDRRTRDVRIATYGAPAVYVVQPIERDNGRDLGSSEAAAYRSALDLAWTGALARTIGQPSAQRRDSLARYVSDALQGLNTIYMGVPKLGNDDPIGRPQRLSLPTRQSTAVLHFRGADGHYRVTFKVA